MKSKWVRVLLAVLVVWAAISFYFYTQHKVVVKGYNLSKTIRVGDTRVVFKQITYCNYSKRMQYGYNEANYPWYFSIMSHLPVKFQLSFYKVCFFYTRPYKVNPTGTLKVKGIIISPDSYEDKGKDGKPLLLGNVSMDIFYNDNYTLGGQQQEYIGSNFELFSIFDSDVPATIPKVRAVITDTKTGEVQSLSISPHWNTRVYHFNLPPEFPFSPAETINQLLKIMLNDDFNKTKVQSLVLTAARDNFPWQNLQHHYWKLARRDEMAYHVSYKGYQNVYSVKVIFLDKKTNNVLAHQKFYLIDQQDTFKIIDVSKVEKNG